MNFIVGKGRSWKSTSPTFCSMMSKSGPVEVTWVCELGLRFKPRLPIACLCSMAHNGPREVPRKRGIRSTSQTRWAGGLQPGRHWTGVPLSLVPLPPSDSAHWPPYPSSARNTLPSPAHVHMIGSLTSFKSLLQCHLLTENVLDPF